MTLLKLELEREKAIVDFLLLEIYSIVTFDDYFKSFELLRRWTMKHHLEVYYSSIDFKAIDKEMMTDEAAKQAQANEQVWVRGEGLENVLVDPCKDWSWIWPNMELGFSPVSPNNEVIELGWKN